jgi:hypothetical protein
MNEDFERWLLDTRPTDVHPTFQRLVKAGCNRVALIEAVRRVAIVDSDERDELPRARLLKALKAFTNVRPWLDMIEGSTSGLGPASAMADEGLSKIVPHLEREVRQADLRREAFIGLLPRTSSGDVLRRRAQAVAVSAAQEDDPATHLARGFLP